MMVAREALAILNRHRTNEVVVTAMTAAKVWASVSSRPELDLPVFGAMGKTSSVGLGIALARPDRRVLILDADGSLLMNLGSLVTIAEAVPANLIHFVFENKVYEITGGQPIPGSTRVSFAGLALAAGYARAYEFERLPDLEARIATILSEPGPTLVSLRVLPGGRELPMPARRTAQAVPEVKAALARG